MPRTALWIGLFFAALGLLYLVLGLRAPGTTSVGANPARKARIRISLIFLVISVFLLCWNRGLW